MDQHLLEYARKRFGIHLSHRHLALVQRAVAHRIRATGGEQLTQYLDKLDRSPREAEVFRSLLLVHTTWFFREPVTLYTLRRRILPGILSDRARAEFRVWSVGCASGEEVYSIAMMALALKTRWKLDMPIRLFGTDLDSSLLATARKGRYPVDRCRNVPLHYAEHYCDRDGDFIQVRPQLQGLAQFSTHDAVQNGAAPADSVYGDFDMIMCRNVLIYYEESVRTRIIRHLTRHLRPGGALVLGLADPVPAEWPQELVELSTGTRIFVHHTPSPSLRLP